MRPLQHSKHSYLTRYSRFFNWGHFQGELFEIDGYPGAIHKTNTTSHVHGEIYEIVQKESLFRTLDAYEECSDAFPHPHEYQRKIIAVQAKNGESMQAWVYLYARKTNTLTQIPNGNYLDYLRPR